jgi:hypothetical protein
MASTTRPHITGAARDESVRRDAVGLERTLRPLDTIDAMLDAVQWSRSRVVAWRMVLHATSGEQDVTSDSLAAWLSGSRCGA